MAKTAKKATKKEKFISIPGSAVAGDKENPRDITAALNASTVAGQEAKDNDNEEMSEAEAAGILERQEKRKADFKAKLENEVDSQEWTLTDPVIPPELEGKVWIAVYRCPEGHKTKATNRQADSGVWCWKHREVGHKVMASIMPQFLNRPVTEDPDIAKRKKAAKGAQ